MMYSPPDPASYNALVWEIVKQIPSGRVSTYGQVASMIPPPDGVSPPDYERLSPRWVGNAMNRTPSDQGIPWQRVINSQGSISLPKSGAERQRELLEAEGVTFDEKGRVDFQTFGWEGPDALWLEAHGLLPPRPLKKPTSASPTQPTLL